MQHKGSVALWPRQVDTLSQNYLLTQSPWFFLTHKFGLRFDSDKTRPCYMASGSISKGGYQKHRGGTASWCECLSWRDGLCFILFYFSHLRTVSVCFGQLTFTFTTFYLYNWAYNCRTISLRNLSPPFISATTRRMSLRIGQQREWRWFTIGPGQVNQQPSSARH